MTSEQVCASSVYVLCLCDACARNGKAYLGQSVSNTQPMIKT